MPPPQPVAVREPTNRRFKRGKINQVRGSDLNKKIGIKDTIEIITEAFYILTRTRLEVL